MKETIMAQDKILFNHFICKDFKIIRDNETLYIKWEGSFFFNGEMFFLDGAMDYDIYETKFCAETKSDIINGVKLSFRKEIIEIISVKIAQSLTNAENE